VREGLESRAFTPAKTDSVPSHPIWQRKPDKRSVTSNLRISDYTGVSAPLHGGSCHGSLNPTRESLGLQHLVV